MTYRPHAHLGTMPDITLVHTTIPAGRRRGWYFPAERGIVIAKGLIQRDRRSITDHEIAHAEDESECCDEQPNLARAQERRVSLKSARRMIPFPALMKVLASYGNVGPEWIPVLAEELHVSDELLRFRIKHLHPSETLKLRAMFAEREEAP